MQVQNVFRRLSIATFVVYVSTSLPASAYIGPGAGLGAIALAVALIASFLLLLVGFLWYPLKRMLKSRRQKNKDSSSGSAS